jgi:hypothetical protein
MAKKKKSTQVATTDFTNLQDIGFVQQAAIQAATQPTATTTPFDRVQDSGFAQAAAAAGQPFVPFTEVPTGEIVERVDRYGRTVRVYSTGPQAGTIVGSSGILYEPPQEVYEVPEPTSTRSPSGIAGQNVSISPTGAVTLTPSEPVNTGPTLARDVFIRTLSQFFPDADKGAAWINELYPVISGYYKSGIPIEQAINLSLADARNNPKLSTFADRFKGIYAIQDLKAAGKPVIVPTIAQYIASEAEVANLFNQAGLSDLANPQGIADVLGKGKAVSQIANEISQVFRRIDLAPQAIKDTLSRYFPTVDRTKLARTILLGDKGIQELTDELAGLEVLSAAEQQGIAATGARGIAGGVTEERARQLARSGVTYGAALPKFAEVRQTAPVEQKLAGISRRQSIGQAGIEQALLLGGAQEIEQIEELSAEERARFQARPGAMQPGLASQRRANRAF